MLSIALRPDARATIDPATGTLHLTFPDTLEDAMLGREVATVLGSLCEVSGFDAASHADQVTSLAHPERRWRPVTHAVLHLPWRAHIQDTGRERILHVRGQFTAQQGDLLVAHLAELRLVDPPTAGLDSDDDNLAEHIERNRALFAHTV